MVNLSGLHLQEMTLHLQHVKPMSSQNSVCIRRSEIRQANPPCFGAPPGIVPVPSRQIPPPPPPPSRQSSSSAADPLTYPMPWTPLNTRPKTSGGGPPDGSGGGGSGSGAGDPTNPPGNAHPGGGGASPNSSGGGVPPGGGPPGGNPGNGSSIPRTQPPPGSTPGTSTANRRSRSTRRQFNSAKSTTPPTTPPENRAIDPWASLDRSRKPLPKLSLPSSYQSCSILDMQQMLEVWYGKSTLAIATWRGDAQRYWLTQVLDLARARHDQWLQSPQEPLSHLSMTH